jgi:hypothetical protein
MKGGPVVDTDIPKNPIGRDWLTACLDSKQQWRALTFQHLLFYLTLIYFYFYLSIIYLSCDAGD